MEREDESIAVEWRTSIGDPMLARWLQQVQAAEIERKLRALQAASEEQRDPATR